MSQRRTLVSGPLAILEPKQGRFRLGGAKWRLYYGVLEASMPYLSLYPSNDTSDPRKCIARINIDDESSARVRDDPNAMVRDPFAAPGSGSGGSGSGGASTRPTVLQLLNVNVTKEPFSARPVTKPAKVLDIDAHSPEQLKKWVTALKAVFAWLKHGTEPPLNLNSSSFEAIGASEVGMSGRDPHHHHQQQHLQHQQHSPYHASSGSLGIPPTAGHYGGGASSRHRSPSIASGGSSLFPGGHMQPAAAPAAEGGSSYAGSIRRPSNSDAGSVHSAGYYGVRPSASFSYPTPPSPGSPVTGASPYDGHGGPIVVRGGTSGSSGSPAPYNNPVAIFPPSGGMRDRPAPIPSSGAPSTSASANGGGGAPMMLPPRAMPKSAFFPGAGGMYGGGSRPARLAIDYGSLDADDDESLLPSPIRPTARGAGIAAAASASRSRSVGPPPSGRRPVHSAPGSRIDDLVAALPASTSTRALPRPTSILSNGSGGVPSWSTGAGAPPMPATPPHHQHQHSGARASVATFNSMASAPAMYPPTLPSPTTSTASRGYASTVGYAGPPTPTTPTTPPNGSSSRRRRSVVSMQMDMLLSDLDGLMDTFAAGDAPAVPPIPPMPPMAAATAAETHAGLPAGSRSSMTAAKRASLYATAAAPPSLPPPSASVPPLPQALKTPRMPTPSSS